MDRGIIGRSASVGLLLVVLGAREVIGFRQQTQHRRPVYSITGQKLCYVMSGPDGDAFYDEAGRKMAKVTKWKQMLGKMEACSSLAGCVVVDPKET